MKRERLRPALSLVSNLLIFVIVLVCIFALVFVPDRPDFVPRFEIFRYYTTLSNVLAGILAVPMAYAAARTLTGKEKRIPRALSLLRYVSVSALTLTMMTVLCFLGPLFGYAAMFRGANFFFHLVVPVLAVLSFLFFETGADFPKKNPFPGIVQTILYAAVYVPMVLSGRWPDFYGFNIGGRWYLSLAAMLTANLLLAWLLLLGRNKASEKFRKDGQAG